MSYNVFISYSTKDYSLVSKVKEILESNAEIEVYVAETSAQIGNILSSELISAIKRCNLFILLWSKNSKNSAWVNQEIGIAASEDKVIVPVVLDEGLKLPEFIQNRKHLNAFDNHEEALKILQDNVFKRAKKQNQVNGLIGLALGAAFLYLLLKE